MKLSVVIPVYRVEQTLQRCVESVMTQLPSESEVILVDDGSDDMCPMLCDQLADDDPRIRVIHQANAGLSAARNTGITAAQGDWITFVDSDDWLESDTLPQVMAEVEKHTESDIVEYPVEVYEGGNNEHRLTFDERTYTDVADYWLDARGFLHAYAWNKVYRRTLFADICYPVGRLFEDVPTTFQLVQKARAIALVPVGLYHYIANPQGITLTANNKDFRQMLESHVDIFNQLWGKLGAQQRMLHYYVHLIDMQVMSYDATPASLLLPTIPLPWSLLTDSGITLKSRMKVLIVKTLGLKTLCQVLFR